MTFHSNSMFCLTPNQTSSKLATETIVLDYQNGEYFELNDVGGFVWQLFQNKTNLSFEEIHLSVLNEYEVDNKTSQNDLYTFLLTLMDENLIKKID